MAFVSVKDRENALDAINFNAEGYQKTPEFWEVYSANVGHVVDENLSISRYINSDASRERASTIRSMIDSGEVSREIIDSNRGRRGNINWGRIAETLNDERVPTDKQIEDDVNYTLKLRREYYEDVTDKGSGIAAFLGQANAYMLDPVNIATMFAGGAGVAKHGIGTLDNIFRSGVRGGVLAGGSEAIIQPFVYSWKNDIDSPYSGVDAISAIATAAIGGALLDSTITSIAGYAKRVRSDIEKLEDAGYDIGDDGIATKEALAEIEHTPVDWDMYIDRSPAAVELRASLGIKEDVEALKNMGAKEKIQVEARVMKAIEREKAKYNSPAPKVDINQKPRIRVKSGEDLTGNARIKKEMEQAGLLDSYNIELAKFNNLDDVKIDIDGVATSSKGFAKQMDDETEIIEQLSRCSLG